MQSLKRGWSFMMAAFQMAGQRKKLLAPALLLIVVTIVYFAGWIAALIAMGAGSWSNGAKAGIGAAITCGSFLIFYFFCGVTVNMIDVHLKGDTPSLGDGARDAAKNFVAITFLAVVSTVIELFAKAARKNDSALARVLAAIVETIWTVFSFLLLPVIILEDVSFGQAMRRVRDLHKRNLLLVGIGEVGVRLVTALISLIGVLVIAGIIYAAAAALSGVAALIVMVMVGGTLFALLAAFNVYLRMAYYTCLYLWAAEVERVGTTARAPGPLGAALGHLEQIPAAA